MGSIYRLYCKESGKNYIGQHNNEDPTKRIRDHFMEAECERSDAVLYKAIRKYGRDAFEAFVVCVCKTQEELDYLEDHYITEYKSMMDENGYNMKRGGMKRCVGYKHTEESKRKLSEMKKGNVISEEQKIKISETSKGHKKNWSDESKETMSERNRENGSKTVMTEELKEKISKTLSGTTKNFDRLSSDNINSHIEKIKKFIDIVEESTSITKWRHTRKFSLRDIIFIRLFPKLYGSREYGKMYGCSESVIRCIINNTSYQEVKFHEKYLEDAKKLEHIFKQEDIKPTYVEVPKEKLEEWSQPVFEQKTIKIPKKKTESKTDEKEPQGLDSVNIPEYDSEHYDINKDIAQVQSIIDEIKLLIPSGKRNQEHSRKLSYEQVIFIRLFPKKFSTRAYGKLMGCSGVIIRDLINNRSYNDIIIPEKYIEIGSKFEFKK